ncbi:acyl carrier protein phosphodiesterase [Flavobacterium rhizosphaerae]|uniref:Acyl carrier protein phosphodiesterase n=1 Tax=Flavobacterium rhizosphaerae TaxID=3163298 RepID=A0ABW8YUW1_9FLAO
MNILAHAYLSADDEEIKIGNFIADGIHGHPLDFSPGIIKGIVLHRAIDAFTDVHPVFRQGTKRLHPVYHHYASVIMDIFYDHFLAKNWHRYHTTPLEEFAAGFYSLLQDNYDILPPRNQSMLPHMIAHNWLVNYAKPEGVARTLSQLDRRTKYDSGMANAINELEEYYNEYEEEFHTFFTEISAFVKEKKKAL